MSGWLDGPPAAGECRSCRQPVVWCQVRTKDGKMSSKLHPVDVVPADGTITHVGWWEEGGRRRPLVVIGQRPAGHHGRLVSHFSTCPDAGKWRGR